MTYDSTLPTLAPHHVQFHLTQQDDGYWELRVWAGDTPGFRVARDWTIYDGLTAGEVVDVLQAVADGLLGLPDA